MSLGQDILWRAAVNGKETDRESAQAITMIAKGDAVPFPVIFQRQIAPQTKHVLTELYSEYSCSTGLYSTAVTKELKLLVVAEGGGQ